MSLDMIVDLEGWLAYTGNQRAMSGQVKKIHRPGLMRGGHLAIPALVEIG